MSGKFYDRVNERRNLSEMIQKRDDTKTRIIVLLGYSGVGKSSLMKKLFETAFQHQCHLQVRIQKPLSATVENDYFFNRLFDAVLEKSKSELAQDNLSLSGPLESFRIGQLLHLFAHAFASKLHIEEAIDDKAINLLQKRDFIVGFLSKTPHIVDIENIQCIDMHSFEVICSIIEQTPASTYVLEYTLSGKEDDPYLDFYSALESLHADVDEFCLGSLNETDALKLLPSGVYSAVQREFALTLYHKKHGNLYQLIHFKERKWASSEDPDEIDAAIRALLGDRRESTAVYLLDLIYLEDKQITLRQLRTFATTPEWTGQSVLVPVKAFSDAVKRLKELRILEMEGGALRIHDSILEALDHQDVNPMLFHAYRTLTSYYTEWRPSGPEQQVHRLSRLFSLYLRFADRQLLSILPDIRRVLLAERYPKMIYDTLLEFRLTLLRQTNPDPVLYREICRLLVEICIESGEPDTGWDILKGIYGLSESEERLLKGRLLELGMQRADMDALDALIRESDKDSHERFLLEMSRLHVAMRLLPQAKSMILAKEITENEQYKQYREYAFALANLAELVDSPIQAIELYKDGIQLLEERGEQSLAGHLYANICMSLAYMGQLEIAKSYLERARESGADEAMYINNRVALELLAGEVSEESVAALKDALLLNSNEFEQLIIHNNILIALVLLNDWKLADKQYEFLVNSGFEKFEYGEFLHLCYQNLLFYCRTRKRKKKAETYIRALERLCRAPDTNEGTRSLIKAMLGQEPNADIFYAKFPYRAEFLCYWGIPHAAR